LAHLLASAILELFPNSKLAIGPAIDNGFYYDMELSENLDEKDLQKIEKLMIKKLPKWKEFTHKEVSPKEAKDKFAGNPYKIELIEDLEKLKEKITLYTCDDFTDLCRGGHAENPAKEIEVGSWKLQKTAGAYWRGDEKNKMLTRIYGLAFDTKEELQTYEAQLEEAKKRDHKKLGKELDLFTFSDLVGSGLPLWTPKGTLIRNLLDEFVWQLRKKYGYEKVEIPHITKKDLYITSGHWEKFQDELFKITTREGHLFAMKPMNCPHHTQIYKRRQWSYKELPQRYANTTACYRDEQTGELSGLSRVRSFAQDDAHVFCRATQVKEEFLKVWEIIHSFYGAFGFKLKVRLSLHDPKSPEKYLGDAERWQMAESKLREIVEEKKADFFEGLGEAAFYGPKLDFMANDSLGRQWQVATIQLDVNMPERFDLDCINEKGEKERIVMIHAAIMGSIERFFSILIEHTAGNFPLWLSPNQISIIPISEKFNDLGKEITEKLRERNIRVNFNDSNEGLGKKIRFAKTEKIPYYIVIGEKEVSAQKFNLENRTGEKTEGLSYEQIEEKLIKEITEKK
jgi:threonyl-tRNA synthetase